MSFIKSVLKKTPLVYYVLNLRNGFWKKGLQVTYGSYNVRIKKIRVKNRGRNNSLYLLGGAVLQDCTIHISGNDNTIYIGEGCSLCGLNLYIEDDDNQIRIGSGTTTTGEVDLSAIEGTKLMIGEDCMLSSKIYISTGDGHSVCDSECNKRHNISKNIYIGNHVWIGTRVIIGKGVEIKDNSIVAAGSVCLASEEKSENVVIGGNPAQIVKRNVNWLRARI